MRTSVVGVLSVLLLWSSAAATEPPGREADYQAAARLYERGRFLEAALAFDSGWNRYGDAAFLFNAATAYEKADRQVQALQLLEVFLVRFETQAEAAQAPLARLAAVVGQTHGRLRVDTEPATARVDIDGTALEVPRWLPPGEVVVTARLDGYEPATRRVRVAAGERMAVHLALTPLPRFGRLQVGSTPAGAEVLVDGATRGRTPLTLDELVIGEHVVRVRGATSELTERVIIEEGKTSQLDLALPAPPVERPIEPPPLVEQWWFWTAIGVGVAAITTGVVLALTLPSDELVEQPAGPADWGVWGVE